MKTIVLIFFHILCAWYPDFFRMAKPDAIKYQSVIPINNQPDQVGIPKPFPEYKSQDNLTNLLQLSVLNFLGLSFSLIR